MRVHVDADVVDRGAGKYMEVVRRRSHEVRGCGTRDRDPARAWVGAFAVCVIFRARRPGALEAIRAAMHDVADDVGRPNGSRLTVDPERAIDDGVVGDVDNLIRGARDPDARWVRTSPRDVVDRVAPDEDCACGRGNVDAERVVVRSSARTLDKVQRRLGVITWQIDRAPGAGSKGWLDGDPYDLRVRDRGNEASSVALYAVNLRSSAWIDSRMAIAALRAVATRICRVCPE